VGRWVLHVDMDAFYASVEQLDNPFLPGRPVIVGGLGPRGVVATASYEARKFGVHSAMPMVKARKLCPHEVFIAPRFERYAGVAERIREILLEYTPLVEPVSLDEAFLGLTGTEGFHSSPERVAREVHRRIPWEMGLSCSVGLAPNKFVAKIAPDRAKPGGLRIVPPAEIQNFRDPLPVEKLWEVGSVTAARLVEFGIRTVQDLRGMDPALLAAWFGRRTGARLRQLARGIDESPIVPEREAKSLSQERTFPADLHNLEEIRAEVRKLALALADRLHAHGYFARLVRIKVRFADFATHTHQMRLPEPTDNAVLITEAALSLLARPGGWEEGVRLLGVSVGELVPAEFRTIHLFAPEELSRTILELRRKFGESAVSLGPNSGESQRTSRP